MHRYKILNLWLLNIFNMLCILKWEKVFESFLLFWCGNHLKTLKVNNFNQCFYQTYLLFKTHFFSFYFFNTCTPLQQAPCLLPLTASEDPIRHWNMLTTWQRPVGGFFVGAFGASSKIDFSRSGLFSFSFFK